MSGGVVPQTGGEPHGELRLLTITGLWRLPRKLHNLGRLRLSLTGPISYRFIVYTVAIFAPALLLFHLLHLPVLGPSMFVRWVLPSVALWAALKHAAHGGRPWELAWSWVAFSLSVIAAAVVAVFTVGGGRPVRVKSRVMLRDRRSVAPPTWDQLAHERFLEWRAARREAAASADDFDVDAILAAADGEPVRRRSTVDLVKGWGRSVQRTGPVDEWAQDASWIDEVLAEPRSTR